MADRRLVEDLLVAAAGMLTSTVLAVVLHIVSEFTGFQLFTFSILLIVPVGALLAGAGAASGYYFASKWLNHRPTRRLLINMVLVAGSTNVLIYYLQYATLVLPDGRAAADLVPFLDYVNIAITAGEYRLGQYPPTGPAIKVGAFGYALSALQFIGFLLGGVWVWLILKDLPYCERCSKYSKERFAKTGWFASVDDFRRFDSARSALSPISEQHLALIKSLPPTINGKPSRGAVTITHRVFACPICSGESFSEQVQVFNGEEWKEVGSGWRVTVPAGHTLLPELTDVPKAA